MDVLDLFCGIGGLAAALDGRFQTAMAIDQNRLALTVYRRNFPGRPTLAKTVESIDPVQLEAAEAALWWASPPCQPFTTKGRRRQLADPRAGAFVRLLDHVSRVRPRFFALENVPGFHRSAAYTRLRDTLAACGYRWLWEDELCPSELGLPNRRRRYFLAAGRDRLLTPTRASRPPRPLADFLEVEPDPELEVEPDLLARHGDAMDFVDPGQPGAIAQCFTAGYGRSATRCGSYLALPNGRVRRFAPNEVKRLLGFPETFAFPPSITTRQAWKLLGNSLSTPCVETALSVFPT